MVWRQMLGGCSHGLDSGRHQGSVERNALPWGYELAGGMAGVSMHPAQGTSHTSHPLLRLLLLLPQSLAKATKEGSRPAGEYGRGISESGHQHVMKVGG